MKHILVLLMALSVFIGGCGKDGQNDPDGASPTPQVSPVSQPANMPANADENLLVAVQFSQGSFHFIDTRWLIRDGNVFRAKSPIRANVEVSDSVRVFFAVPSIITDIENAFIRARYGCSDPRQGDIYFVDASMSEVGSEVSSGKTVFKATMNDLQPIFRICRQRPVSIAVEIYKDDLKTIDAYVVVYLQADFLASDEDAEVDLE